MNWGSAIGYDQRASTDELNKSPVAAIVRTGFNARMADPENEQAEGVIECRVTSWYFRRMGLLAAMLLVFGGLFFYDGIWGYPAKNKLAEVKERFDEEVLKGYDKARAANTLDQWRSEMQAKNWPVDVDGEPPKWLAYSAQHDIPEKPKKYTEREVAEQFWYGGAMALGAIVVGVLVLLNRGKVLRGFDDHLITPEGAKVRFADVFKIDKRKWDNKGLAYLWHRPNGSGAETKAVIDDLKYQGAVRVLDRLLANFRGELIEKVADPEAEETVSDTAATGKS